MEMAEGFDSGDMIIWDSIPISSDDDAITVHDKLSILGGELIVKALDDIKMEWQIRCPKTIIFQLMAAMLDKNLGKLTGMIVVKI